MLKTSLFSDPGWKYLEMLAKINFNVVLWHPENITTYPLWHLNGFALKLKLKT